MQAALREFFLSIATEKDQEQSWKKAIYKVIARLDEVVPEYFKSSNWLEHLSDCWSRSTSSWRLKLDAVGDKDTNVQMRRISNTTCRVSY